MKSFSLFFLAWTCVHVAVAQQDPLYSQYINNPFVLNPAYAGMSNNLAGSASYRHQWAGMEGAPTTLNVNGHISLDDNRMGTGLMMMADKIGVTSLYEVNAAYAYRINVSASTVLSFGIQAGMLNFKNENSEVKLEHPGDPVFASETSETKPTIGTGAIISSDRFFVGLSVPRLLKTEVKSKAFNTEHYTQHLYFTGAYLFFVNDRIRFRPSVTTRLTQGAPAATDVSTSLIFHERYTAGLLTRNFSTYGILLNANLTDAFRLGYVFEIPMARSVGTKFTTHEITIGFRANVYRFHKNSVVYSF
jgi:type IX secretion system PorP/SprF family membrane protein